MSSFLKTGIVIIALGVSFGLIYKNTHLLQQDVSDALEMSTASQNFFKKPVDEASTKIYTFLVGGDMMLDRGVEGKTMSEGAGDWTFPFQLIAPTIQEADLAFANLEGSLSDVGADGRGGKLSFRFNPASASGLQYAGFDVLSLANNHILDWGRASLCATPKNLASVGIASVGAGCNREEAERPFITELGNTKMAVLASTVFYKGAHATETQAGIRELNNESILAQVRDLKENQGVDLVFLSMHWGEEYKTRSTKEQQDFAHVMLDGGIDVIIGHHPHVPEEIERYGKGWIIYSLGNLVFDQHISEETMGGMMANIKIQNKKILDIEPFHITINKSYQPFVDEVL